MEKDLAIKVENLSKTFKIPHEKISTIRGAFVSAFKTKTYEEFKALNNVSFEVKKGEFFGIIGRNGSGKSTLLKILAGVYKSDGGKVQINGLISPFLELGIGFQPELSGRDNIYLNATVLGLTKKQIDEKFDEIVKFSEIGRFIDQKIKNYSSGMQVRLAFSVAVHANRDILLMDEVLAVGDSHFQKKCLAEFMRLKQEGKTIVFVSHDLESVKKYCDQVMLINDGEKIMVSEAERSVFEYSRLMMEEGDGAKILDDRKDAVKKQKKKANKYLNVELFDSKGNKTKVFKGGEKISVKIKLEVNSVEEDMFVSVGIFDKDSDALVCENNMFFENFQKHWTMGGNEVELIFNNNFLNSGNFYIKSSFFKGDPKDNYLYAQYSGKGLNEYFQIIPRGNYSGLTYLPHEWKI